MQEFFHNKTLDADQECETCDSGRAARKKCIECTDWMCNQCCSMHLKVGLTHAIGCVVGNGPLPSIGGLGLCP